jgi:hypothetical protein
MRFRLIFGVAVRVSDTVPDFGEASWSGFIINSSKHLEVVD